MKFSRLNSTRRLCLSTAMVIVAASSIGAKEYPDSVVLEEVEVSAAAQRNLKSPELGRISLSGDKMLRLPVMFGEPDLIKVLQLQPGVSHGMEGFTGLYVHGGNNDQNLFLFQGLPLNNISHLGGVFSAFNVAMVDRADFYKASFPARYGGRVSSITEIGMRASDLEHLSGRISAGLISGNVAVSGPLVKNRTGFNLGIRRTWLDAISAPALAIMNAIHKKNGKKTIARYAFTDANLRIDHRFSDNVTAYAIGYLSSDNLKFGERKFQNEESETEFFDESTNQLKWSSVGALGAVKARIGAGMLGANLYWVKYSSEYQQKTDYQTNIDDPSTYSYNHNATDNSMSDFGFNLHYNIDISQNYRLQAGAEWVNHHYRPEGLISASLTDGTLTDHSNSDKRIGANTLAMWADNELTLTDRLALSLGLHYRWYGSEGVSHNSLEPRVGVRLSLSGKLSIKVGYALTTQYVQQVSNNYVSLPTDLWQPIAGRFKPLHCHQFSAGLYGNLSPNLYFSAEGWYKRMFNLLEYREGISSLNPNIEWSEKLTSGRGWAYGADLAVNGKYGPVSLSLGYGLMWNWRKFASLNQGRRFPAKFDNRHKINLNATYKPTNRIEFTAGWTYTTGNRLTLSLYNYDYNKTFFPQSPSIEIPHNSILNEGISYYSSRNNVRLPAYHRLDLGMSVFSNYKNGRRGIWNVSIYNAYCHMNSVTISKEGYDLMSANHDHRVFKTFSFIPIIPSFSYTYIF